MTEWLQGAMWTGRCCIGETDGRSSADWAGVAYAGAVMSIMSYEVAVDCGRGDVALARGGGTCALGGVSCAVSGADACYQRQGSQYTHMLHRC